VLMVIASLAKAEVIIFTEDFESGLGRWTGLQGVPTTGFTIVDPLGTRGNVLAFSGLSYQGDIFTAEKLALSNFGFVKVKFDYLGKAVSNSPSDNFGGFLGIATTLATNSGAWLAGTNQSVANGMGFTGIHLIDDGNWHSYEVDITNLVRNNSLDGIFLKMEDWGVSGSVGDVYFDNIVVSVPEPSSSSLLLIGVAGVASRRLLKRRS